MTGARTLAANTLTQKELEVLALIAQGHDAKSAATELSISYHTIYERLRRARTKLGVSSSREAARIVFQSENHQKFVGENLGLGEPSAITATTYLSSDEQTGVWSVDEIDRQPIQPPTFWSSVLRSLPLRALDERQVRLSKAQRLQLISNLSAKLAVTFVAICFAALIASTLFKRG